MNNLTRWSYLQLARRHIQLKCVDGYTYYFDKDEGWKYVRNRQFYLLPYISGLSSAGLKYIEDVLYFK